MRHPVLALLLAAALVTGPGARPVTPADLLNVLTDHSLTAWGLKDGLPSSVIWAVAQDVDGYLWLGTDAGAVRFDGARFVAGAELFPDGFPALPVRSIYASEDGSVWFGFAEQGGVNRLSQGEVRRYGPADGLDEGMVTMLFEHPDGTMWAGNTRGLYRLSGDRWEKSPDGVPDSTVHTAFVDRAGHFLVGTAVGVFRRAPGARHFVQADAFTELVRGISQDETGTVWVSDPVVGFRQLDERRVTTNWFEKGRGYRLLYDGRGNLWVGTSGQGLWRVRLGTGDPVVERVSTLTGFSDDGVTSLLEDRDGNVWAATLDGLNRLTPYDIIPVMNLGLVSGVEVTSDGSVWIGTVDSLVRFADGDVHRRGVPYMLPAPLTAMHADRHGALWVATGDVVHRLQQGALSAVELPGPTLQQVTAITSDLDGGVWICDLATGPLRWKGGRLERLRVPRPLHAVEVLAAHADRSGRVWFAFANGEVVLVDRAGEPRVYGPEQGLTAGVYRAIYEDRHGAIWLSGSDGVSRFDEGRAGTVHAATSGLPAGPLTAIVEDDDGALWLAARAAAVVRLDPREFDKALADPAHRIRYSVYDKFDGFAGTPRWYGHRSAARANDGRLWFVAGRGVSVIDPQSLPVRAATPHAARIEGVIADSRPLPARSPGRLPAGTNRLDIQYTVLNLTSPFGTLFRYRLNGFDTEWIDAGTRREAFYTNLPPRSYEFEVMAGTDDGTWVEPAAVWRFSIAPMFYQTTGFLVVCVVGIAAAVGGAWRLHVRRVRKQFALLFSERARLSREIHDTLLQSLVGVALQCDDIANDLEADTRRRDQVVRLRKRVEEYIREARQSIWDLRSPKLEASNLSAALSDAGEQTVSGLRVSFDLVVTGRPRRCAPKVEEHLLRIGQEAMLNAVRHARATRVSVALRYEPATVGLRVSDDGHGFDPGNPAGRDAGHYGLVSMKERAAEIDGRITISSAAGRGTEIDLVVPA